jgi:hypothetical protein
LLTLGDQVALDLIRPQFYLVCLGEITDDGQTLSEESELASHSLVSL